LRFDHLHHHLSRRQLFKAGAVGAAATVAHTSGLAGLAGAGESAHGHSGGMMSSGRLAVTDEYDDSFSIEGALDGSWAAETSARYGADDERGAVNEITPAKTAAALAMLDSGKVKTVTMAHLMRNGFPAYVTFPPRRFEQRITVLGYEPGNPDEFFSTTTTGFAGEDEWRAADRERGPLGYVQGTTPLGANELSGHEERYPEGGTLQIATQLDGLAHIGVRDIFYNGHRASEFTRAHAVTKLGIHLVGPVVTRGVLVDVLGYKQACGPDDVQMIDGRPVLTDRYRITVEDIVETLKWEGVGGIEAGDVVVIRTGWNQLAELALENEDQDLFDRYLAGEPGIYIREAKMLGDHRPAIIASDSWALELVGVPDPNGWAFPVHTELLTKRGIRIGESVISDGLAENGNFEFVYCYMPNHHYGATAGATAPFALVNDES